MSLLTSTKIQRYVYLESIASTNDYLLEYLSKSKPLTCICAYSFNQTNGKGQIGRKWFSDSQKNISLSLLVHFNKLPVDQHYLLNKSICLSLLSYISELLPGQKLKIKWPNDIYLEDKKIAGLLIQNQLRSQTISNSIIGIGFNLNQNVFPAELPYAVSILQATGKSNNLIQTTLDLANKFLEQLDSNLMDPIQVENIYHTQLYGLNEIKDYRVPGEKTAFEAIVRGVSKEGKLVLEKGSELLQFSHGDIELVL